MGKTMSKITVWIRQKQMSKITVWIRLKGESNYAERDKYIESIIYLLLINDLNTNLESY